MNSSRKRIIAGVSGLLFIILIVLVRKYDVQAIGPNGTKIGLSGINEAFHKMTGTRTVFYTLTEYLGYLALGVAGLFALAGLIQLVKRKSFAKVDGEIYALGVLYAVTIGLYVLFEKMIVNYRPVIMEGETEVEASFPSSHTMLICVIMGSTAMVADKYFENEALRRFIKVACICILTVTVLGRLFCGVHWFTDILGGLLVSTFLLCIFSDVVDVISGAYEE